MLTAVVDAAASLLMMGLELSTVVMSARLRPMVKKLLFIVFFSFLNAESSSAQMGVYRTTEHKSTPGIEVKRTNIRPRDRAVNAEDQNAPEQPQDGLGRLRARRVRKDMGRGGKLLKLVLGAFCAFRIFFEIEARRGWD